MRSPARMGRARGGRATPTTTKSGRSRLFLFREAAHRVVTDLSQAMENENGAFRTLFALGFVEGPVGHVRGASSSGPLHL